MTSEKENVVPDWLENIRSENPFRVPEGYFADLTEEIQGKIAAESAPAENIKHLARRAPSRWLLSCAAAVAILVLGLAFLWRDAVGPDAESLQALSMQEIEVYLIENLDQLDEELLYDADVSIQEWNEGPLSKAEETVILNLLDDAFDEELLQEIL